MGLTTLKVLAGEVAIATAELTGNGNRTLALDETDDRGHRVLRRSLDTHMNVIRHHMPFNDPALFLTRQFMEDRTQFATNLAKQLVPTSFGYEDDVVLAIPARMSRRRTECARQVWLVGKGGT